MTHKTARQHSGTSEPVKICPVHPTIASKKKRKLHSFLKGYQSSEALQLNVPTNVGYTFEAGGIFSLTDFDIGNTKSVVKGNPK